MRLSKRCFDLWWTSLGLMILFPLLLLIGLAILITDPGPIFFRQERIGLHGRPFRIWKFRTMVVDAERLGAQLTVGRDPRITRIGAILRATKLDELPQLLNVLRGEMSLVGPRPEVRRYVDLYTVGQRRVLDLVPGITDEASIRYRTEAALLAASADPHATYINDVMPEKIRINLAYANVSSIWSDFIIIVKTILGHRS